MRQLKFTFLTLSVLLFTQNVMAQLLDDDSSHMVYYSAEEFLPVAAGTPFNDMRYIEAQGSAYFEFRWENGTVITKNGQAYKDVPIRIDLVANKIHYKSEDGRALIVGTPLRDVKYQSNDKTIHFVHGDILPNKKNGWFQLLVNDSVSLLKSFKKIIEERVSYGGNQLYINTTESYLLFFNNTEHLIKKPADLTDVLPAKKAEIEAEIKKTKSLSKEAQMVSLVTFMNTLL